MNGALLNVAVLSLLALLSVLSVIGEFIVRNSVILRKTTSHIVRETVRR